MATSLMNSHELLALALGLALGAGLFLLVTPSARARKRVSHPRDWGVVVLSFAIAVGAGVLALMLTGVIGLAIAIAGLGASILPWFRARARRRLDATSVAAFPEIIETLISRVRSGDNLLGALGRSGSDAPSRVSRPLALFADNYRHTGNADVCLDELKTAWSSSIGDVVVESIRVAHFTGGANTLVVLRELADQVRRDLALRRDIQAKQTWVQVAARVGVAAPWVVLIFLSFRSEAVEAYNSPTGIGVLVVGLVFTVVAYWVMLAIARPPHASRVFAS